MTAVMLVGWLAPVLGVLGGVVKEGVAPGQQSSIP